MRTEICLQNSAFIFSIRNIKRFLPRKKILNSLTIGIYRQHPLNIRQNHLRYACNTRVPWCSARMCLFRTFVSRNFRIAHNPGISRLSFRTRKINTTTGCCVRWMHYSSLCAGVPGICITDPTTTTTTESEFLRSTSHQRVALVYDERGKR